MIEKIVQILGMGWVIVCLGFIAWTIIEYIHLKFKKPRT
tara:strand:+ start:298 stop:414 length:117 start_codon:yes stop_codon:yes gene_type:complete